MADLTAETVASWYASGEELTEATVAEWAETIWHPQIEWRAMEGAPDDVGPIHGRERLARYYLEWVELFEDMHAELLEQHQVGERVVLAMRVSARSRSTGVPVDLHYSVVLELSGDKIIRGREYATVEEALAAAAA
jgi:ketosteroid isomerase-like protein